MSNDQAEIQTITPMESPCNNICTIDSGTGLCIGCGRSRNEIAVWSSITSAERRRIMAELPARLSASQKTVERSGTS